MTKLIQILLCIFALGFTLCAYINQLNHLTELRLKIPLLQKELKLIQEENTRLQYEIDQFESPIHLMELMKQHEFVHLQFPYTKDIVVLHHGNKKR